NRKELTEKRGAPWTFSRDATMEFTQRVQTSSDQVIIALTFNHAKNDPVPGGLKIGPEVQVCLFEVNYLPSKEEPWDVIAGLID
ncbi:hypothetical protein FOC4_h10017045, partial [Fusarium odoratissimum]